MGRRGHYYEFDAGNADTDPTRTRGAAARVNAAAAQELLAALQSIVAECSGPNRPYSGDSYLPEQFLSAARAAIAAAVDDAETTVDLWARLNVGEGEVDHG